jgi:hypothetical protein
MAIGLDLVDEHGSLLAAVPSQIALTVAGQIQAAGPTTRVRRLLPDSRVDRAAFPVNVAR